MEERLGGEKEQEGGEKNVLGVLFGKRSVMGSKRKKFSLRLAEGKGRSHSE